MIRQTLLVVRFAAVAGLCRCVSFSGELPPKAADCAGLLQDGLKLTLVSPDFKPIPKM
ncbi:hypothetical protein [Alloyangia pacifica]|uniref:hypothetical protein n=1 Tax=Alloyangia pacifica TaxID=311180 RepID=UPI001CD4D2C4|nr:hypothetical protein [Alloyangia pacifica]MCA0996329.1 hypothetical protein [Alloyangia pacifica]